MPEQLTFSLPAKEALGREDYFVSDANHLAVAAVENWAEWPLRKLVLVGPAASGKTHLAQVWAGEVGARVLAAGALDTDPTGLATGPMVIEDIDTIAGDRAAETTLFHLHNLMQSEGHPLLMTSSKAPGRLRFGLADVQSRMEGTSLATLDAPDDALLMALVMKMFADRQIALPPDVLAYAMPRLERSFGAARAFVEGVDGRALAEQRPIGKGLARDVLAEMGQEHDR